MAQNLLFSVKSVYMKPLNKYQLQAELKKELHNRRENDRYVFYDDYLSIEYVQQFNWLYINWKGHQTEQSVTIGCEKMLDAFQTYGCFKVLNDNTNTVGIWTPGPARLDDWFSRMRKSGLKYFAWVAPPGTISRISNEELSRYAEGGKILKIFDEMEEASIWLRQDD